MASLLPPLPPPPAFCLLVFGGGAGEQGERGGDQPDSGGPGSAPQSQLERRVPHRQRRPLWTLHHPHQPHHQRGHADGGQGERKKQKKRGSYTLPVSWCLTGLSQNRKNRSVLLYAITAQSHFTPLPRALSPLTSILRFNSWVWSDSCRDKRRRGEASGLNGS